MKRIVAVALVSAFLFTAIGDASEHQKPAPGLSGTARSSLVVQMRNSLRSMVSYINPFTPVSGRRPVRPLGDGGTGHTGRTGLVGCTDPATGIHYPAPCPNPNWPPDDGGYDGPEYQMP